MARGGKFDFKELKKLQKQIEQLEKEQNAFCEECARYLAARLLAKVIKRTPVGKYGREVKFTAKIPAKLVQFTTKDGKRVSFNTKAKVKNVAFSTSRKMIGGTLRRGWTTQSSGSGAEGMKTSGAAQYVDTLKVNHSGDTYVVEITNPVEYASYVEYGHRTANHKGWVKGHFMLTISERELQSQAPKMIQRKLEAKLKEVFHA